MIRRWWRHWQWKRDLRAWEVYLFNRGTYPKWQRVRDENTRLGVWKRWPL